MFNNNSECGKLHRARFLFLKALPLVFCAILFFAWNVHAGNGTLRIAVAANFIAPFEEISRAFEEKNGVKIEASFSSSGKFYEQIMQGAPYDIFLSADEERPNLLASKDVAEAPFIYATGRVVLWSSNKGDCHQKKR